jgi:hypothetical protein
VSRTTESVSNHEDWQDGSEFVDDQGNALPDLAEGSILVAMRRSAKTSTDADLVFKQEWLVYADNTVQWLVPAESMADLVADNYDLEIISVGDVRRVTIRGSVCVLQGINPV